MRRLLVLAALLFALPAHALVEIDWVTVGDPGNAADTDSSNDRCGPFGDQPCGSVAYTYLIGKYETTNAQYAEFLNAVADTDTYDLYKTNMGSWGITRTGSAGSYDYSTIAGREDMPVNYVSWYDSLRFANWLHNGQPTGGQDSSTTEDGAYTMITESYPNGPFITRNAGATIFLPSEDEWYKAAYYDAVSMSYFDYPAGSDVQTACAVPGATPNTANCESVVDPDPWGLADLTDVGSYTSSASPNGTFDQGGNVWEWNEAIIGSKRGLRGGCFYCAAYNLGAWNRYSNNPTNEYLPIGFRVAMIPETLTACIDGLDNDGDTLIDFPDDPGCFNPDWFTENPQCQDSINNDPAQDSLIDFDGGDPQCRGPWDNNERCGLGAELAFLLPLLWLYRRRRS